MEVSPERKLEFVERVVSSYLVNNEIEPEKVGDLIASAHAALEKLGQPAAPAVAQPVMSPRAAVKPDSIACLKCGKPMKMLKRHLMTEHGMTTEEYRAAFNLPADYPLVAPNYSERRRGLALDIGLGRKPKK